MTILKINFKTGTAWTESIYVEGTKHDDLVYLIDEYFNEHGELPVELYETDEIQADCSSEQEFADTVDNLLAINGGEYYIDGIDSVEELDELADEDEIKQAVLSNYLNVQFDDLVNNGYNSFTLGRNTEYLVLSDDEADDATDEYIKDNLWTLNSSFLAGHCIIEDYSIATNVIEIIQNEYENGNDSLLALVDDIDDLIDDAIYWDGRGWFLSSYDGEEIEHMGYYIYRIN